MPAAFAKTPKDAATLTLVAMAQTDSVARKRKLYDEFYSKSYDALMSVAVRLVGKSGDLAAEDLVQEVFLLAWRKHEKFEGRSTALTWLAAILRNLIHDSRRRDAGIRLVPMPEDEDRRATEPDFYINPDVEAQIDSARIRATVRLAIQDLPRTSRDTLLQSDFGDHSLADVSARTQLNRSTLKVRLFRARHELQALLKDNPIVCDLVAA